MVNEEQLLALENFVALAIKLGVSSFGAIRALLSDAGHDDEVLDTLEVKYRALYDSVKKAAGE